MMFEAQRVMIFRLQYSWALHAVSNFTQVLVESSWWEHKEWRYIACLPSQASALGFIQLSRVPRFLWDNCSRDWLDGFDDTVQMPETEDKMSAQSLEISYRRSVSAHTRPSHSGHHCSRLFAFLAQLYNAWFLRCHWPSLDRFPNYIVYYQSRGSPPHLRCKWVGET